jgi:biopolymer transport protein ExbD
MLDMSFQLLAFFILTFQAPSLESRIDLELPIGPAALPPAIQQPRPGQPAVPPSDLQTELRLDAEAGPGGQLASLRLEGASLADTAELERRLLAYKRLLEGAAPRLIVRASSSLRYEEAARILGALSRAGVTQIRLAPALEAEGPSP